VSGIVDPALEQRIRDAYAAFSDGDVERLRAFFREDARYDAVDVGEVAQGSDGVLAMVTFHGRGRTSGAPVDVPMAHVLQFDAQGLVAELAWYGTRQEAAAAAGV
jgi:ketosteroid isomerase-like protein